TVPAESVPSRPVPWPAGAPRPPRIPARSFAAASVLHSVPDSRQLPAQKLNHDLSSRFYLVNLTPSLCHPACPELRGERSEGSAFSLPCANTFLSFSNLAFNSSGCTPTSPVTAMKFVSPSHRCSMFTGTCPT